MLSKQDASPASLLRVIPHGMQVTGRSTRPLLASNVTLELLKPDKQTIAALIRDIQSRHGKLRIIGHKDASSTACPGRYYPPATVLAPYLGGNSGVPAAPKPPAASAPGGSVDELARAVLAGRLTATVRNANAAR